MTVNTLIPMAPWGQNDKSLIKADVIIFMLSWPLNFVRQKGLS